MIAGVVWSVIGFAICEITHRGKLTTTIVTAVAGVLGLGAGVVRQATAASPDPGLLEGAALGLVLVGVGVVVMLWRARRGGRHRHGSAAIASTRYVLYRERKDDPRHQGRARPDRIRPEGWGS